MASSTTNLDLISAGQAQKEVTANALLDSASPAMFGARRASTSGGLVWGYYGGVINGNTVANGTLTLPPSTTSYIEANATSGAITSNTSGFSGAAIRLYQVTTSASGVTSYTDHRQVFQGTQAAYTSLGITTVAATTYTLLIGDAGRYVRTTSTSAVTVTIPTNTTAAFPVGTFVHVRQAAAGQVTLVGASGVTLTSPETLKTRKAGSVVTLVKTATNAWDVFGDLE